MAGAVRFEQLEVWRKARALTCEINRITAVPPFARDFGLKNQIKNASVSVMSNIAEGFESGSLKSFVRYLHIAKASLAEVRSQLYVALDAKFIQQDTHGELIRRTEELSRMLRALIRSLIRKLENTKS